MKEKTWKMTTKKKLLVRMILAYLLFCLIGFIATSALVSKGEAALRHLTFTPTELKAFFFNGYYLIYLVVIAAALLMLLFYLLGIYRPLHRISKEAIAYAEGNYEEPIHFTGAHELGFLADVMNCMARELNTLEDDQRKFISNISHDFRSPLTSIKGYAEAIADGTIPPELQGKYLNIIVSETERLEKLTQGLLELNKYHAKGAYMNLSVFDIHEMIRQTALTFEGRCLEHQLKLKLRIDSQPLYVKADDSKIEQVLHNLIDNAVKFSDYGGSITVSTKVINGKAFISIKDSGMGIPKDSLNKIWERFYKTDLSRGKDKTGSGLGLAIVKEIIQAHHENINVISTEGVGTEFIFSLTPASSADN